MSRAVCLRCGGDKGGYDHACTSCGHVPTGEGLLVAWLLSDAHLTATELDASAARIRDGSSVRPTDEMLRRARRAVRRTTDDDTPLSLGPSIALFLTSLWLTPLPGLTAWAWWRTDRPRTARQVLALSLPAGVIGSLAISWWVLSSRLG